MILIYTDNDLELATVGPTPIDGSNLNIKVLEPI